MNGVAESVKGLYMSEPDVIRAREGDEAAFHRLVEHSSSAVCAIALAITRNIPASEDVAQESYLAAWSNLPKLRHPSSFLPWLRQLARNKAHQWQRNLGRNLGEPWGRSFASSPLAICSTQVSGSFQAALFFLLVVSSTPQGDGASIAPRKLLYTE